MQSISKVATDRNTAFSAADARAAGFIPLALPVIREHGPAAQSLGALLGILRMDGKTTFRPQDTLARAAGVSMRTFRDHLRILERAGLIETIGEVRQTNTHRLRCPEADLLAEGYLPLPRFALVLPWAQRAAYAFLIFRCELGPCEDSQRAIGRAIGLPVRTIRRALVALEAAGWIERGESMSIRLLGPPIEGADNSAGSPERGADNSAGTPGQSCRQGADNSADSYRTVERSSKRTGFSLRILETKDLANMGKLLALLARAVQAGLLADTESIRLRWIAAAIHAQRVGDNPAGLFTWIVSGERWHVITCDDEDAAVDRLKAHQRRSARPAEDVQELLAAVVKAPDAPPSELEFERRRLEILRDLKQVDCRR